MRDKTVGRWMVRMAVTLGAGALVLGLGTVAANADTTTSKLRVLPTSVSVLHQAPASSDQLFTTEDYTWD